MAMVFDPISELGLMTMTLKSARLDADVGKAVADLEARSRAKPAGAAGWAALYRDAVALIPVVEAAQARATSAQAASLERQRDQQRLTTIDGLVSGVLQRAPMEWQERLGKQKRELEGKVERSLAQLAVEGVTDPATGDTVFGVEAATLEGFKGWLAGAEATWRENNQQLVAARTDEALDAAVGEWPASVTFRVAPAELAASRLPFPVLKGHAVETPGKFAVLGATYKVVFGGVMAVASMVGLASRFASGVLATVAPWAVGLGFAVALGSGLVTVPRKQRQAMAKLRVRATEQVHRELGKELATRLERLGQEQLDAIKKHLTAEGRRFKSLLRTSLADGPAEGHGPMMPPGLGARELERLRGEWPAALRKRIGELEAAG